MDANRAPQDAELADVIDRLGNPPALTLQDVIDHADSHSNLSRWLEEPKNQRAIPLRFKQCDYVPVRNPNKKDRFWVIEKRRQVIYALADLSLSEQLAAAQERAEKPGREVNQPGDGGSQSNLF